jgi:hypothetical protein
MVKIKEKGMKYFTLFAEKEWLFVRLLTFFCFHIIAQTEGIILFGLIHVICG